MKKRLYMLLTLLLIIGLFGCQPDDQQTLDARLDDVVITYQGTDNANQVTQDITLLTSLDDISIRWTSSHRSIISTTGVVTRPEVDTTVTLTAKFTLGTATAERQYMLIVKAAEVVVHPLDQALQNVNATSSYTMNITFTSGDESYPVIIKMGETTASVEALGETLYYEVDGEVCYIYEYIQNAWVKNTTTCSEKGTSELAFLTGFSKDYFVEQVENSTTFYVLKMEYYQSLQSFLNSSSTSSFRMTLSGGYIETISMIMTRDNITFNVSITLSLFNQTTITLPVITS